MSALPEASIVVKSTDRFSDAMKTMADSSRAFSKDLDGMQERLDNLNRTHATLKIDTDRAREDLREAEDQFRDTGSEADRLNLMDKKLTFENARRNMSMFGKEAGNVERQMLKMGDAFSKADNRAGGIMSSMSALTKGLATAGFGKMMGDTLQQSAGYAISSAFNSSTGNVLSKVMGDAVSGAAMGRMISPAGAVVGGLIGAANGAVSGVVENAAKKDDTMRKYAAESEQSAVQASKARAQSSSATAAKREQDSIAFASLMGSKSSAKSLLAGVNDMANHTPYVYDDLTGIAKTLNVYDDKNEKSILSHLKTIGNTGAALGLSTADMDSVAQVLGFMGSNGRLDSMILKQLRHKGINANQMLAESYGVSTGQFSKMVSGGKVDGADAMNRLYAGLSRKYAGMMDLQSKTFSGLQSTITGLRQNVENTQGTAYNKTIAKSQKSEIDMLGGAVGKEMSKMYSMIGEGKGIQQNRESRIEQEVVGAVLTGKKFKDSAVDGKSMQEIKSLHAEYKAAKKEFDSGNNSKKAAASAKMDAIRQKMDILSGDVIDESKTFDSMDDAEKDVAGYSQKIASTIGAYKDKWAMEETRSKGILAYYSGAQGNKTGAYGLTVLREGESGGSSGKTMKPHGKPNAWGLDYVPYDNFPALLHEGERVQTAVEARSEHRKTTAVVIQGNNFHIREDADIDRVASLLLKKIQLAGERG